MDLNKDIRTSAVKLRMLGRTYGEIQKIIGRKIPKSTLSYWCAGIALSDPQRENIKQLILKSGAQGRIAALKVNREKRERYLAEIDRQNGWVKGAVENVEVAKLVLAALYLGEGTKRPSAVIFANSNPEIIGLFLKLLRSVYPIDERKFRCTLMCRADQDVAKLEKFWSKYTGISRKLFKPTRIDPRTVGKPSINKEYRGVCRIDYYSAHLVNDILSVGKMLCK